jgi:hypothetical protein
MTAAVEPSARLWLRCVVIAVLLGNMMAEWLHDEAVQYIACHQASHV